MNVNREVLTKHVAEFPMRLQVYLAHSGVASRRACETLIQQGLVKVNGNVITELGTKVNETDVVTFKDEVVKLESKKLYILLYKPKGYVCSLSDDFNRPLASDLLKDAYTERLYNVGRLDLYSSGAIFFTNDGNFAKNISHPSSQIEKEYLIETVYPFDEKVLKDFMKGIVVENITYKCKSAKKINEKKMCITLIEGKNREIRRVLKAFDIKVRRLLRIRIGNIELGNLKPGEFRELTQTEINELLKK